MQNDSGGELFLALTTAPDPETARRLGHALVEEKLVACANLVPGLSSIYRWKGEVQNDAEVLLLLKTQRSRLPRLKERLPELHPYEVPELLALPIADGLASYYQWVVEETSEDRG
jgi:periplasmic divalent cation tolerance protein